MTDPEIAYRRLTSGDVHAIRHEAASLTSVLKVVDEARDGLHEATGVPIWTGHGAGAFAARSGSLLQGLQTGYMVVDLVQGGIETAASAYDSANRAADFYIAFWRNRPGGLPAVIEEPLARAVQDRIEAVSRSYDEQLSAVTSVLTGDTSSDLDLDDLDDETRDWVEDGLDRTDDWLDGDGEGSSLGPLIPNTAATGDGRNLTPQGLGYDPASGSLIQGYADEDSGDLSGLALIDESTGRELGEVSLDGQLNDQGDDYDVPPPQHVGGVTVDGDDVIVTSEGRIYTYPLNQIQNRTPGQPVRPTRVDDTVAGSYSALHGDQLYVGDFDHDVMRVYDRRPGGGWMPSVDESGQPVTVDTPPQVQGVVITDDHIVYSTSEGRGYESQMVVDDLTGGDLRTYDFPNMSEGIVEVDGELITTYESGAQKYSDWEDWYDEYIKGDLWAGPYMTRTPLEELGLDGELEAEPSSLRKAAGVLGDPAASLTRVASMLDGVRLPSGLLGEVPSAAVLSSAVQTIVRGSADSARTSSAGVERLAEGLEASAKDYQSTDEGVGRHFGGGRP